MTAAERFLAKFFEGREPEEGKVVFYNPKEETWYVGNFDLDCIESGATLIEAIQSYDRENH